MDKKPRVFVGDEVRVEFSNEHPEVTGIVEFISDEHISIGEKRFRRQDVKAIHLACEICGSLTDLHYDELCFK